MPSTDVTGDEPEIVFITRKWAPATGGMETYSVRLTQEIARRHPVQVISLPGRAGGMPPGVASLLLFPFTVVRRLAARHGPARVIHLGDLALWPIGLLAGRRTKVVVSAHGTDVAYHRRGGLRGRLYGAYLRLGARLLGRARLVANSHATAQVAAETGWRTHCVIPLAADPVEAGKAEGHESFILFAGRLVARKGCGWFVREVLPSLPEGIQLRIAGTVWDESERAALDDERVEFLGPQEPAALARLYRAALCVIVPNIDLPNGEYEGFGLVAPEAASAGGLVLAAASGGLTDAVIDGETGFLLPSGDAEAWATRINDVAAWPSDKRQAFTEKAQALSREVYSWDRVAEETVAVYFDRG
ncbi:glycosyltransferase family 4 protein [Aurantiacibacter hainanensis]|uniref:glycosyltransferase family 4 protein n=1 Tax=Aurantiacibacter hainanensis TaxID=3076114 RepID=UPI0030C70023